MIYEGGWLEELAACGVLTPSSQRGQRVSAGLACAPGSRVCPARVCAGLACAPGSRVRPARVCARLACPPGSRVRPARGGVSSWVPAAPGPVPTRAGAGRARVVHGLPDRGSLGGSVDNRS